MPWIRLLLALGVAAVTSLLAACGTTYATAPSRSSGAEVMLLGHDPVAYFQLGQAQRGTPEHQVTLAGERTYYFANARHKRLFELDPAAYEPKYGGFCASGAAYGVMLGSDPTAWEIRHGRLYIFGDVLGKTAWQIDPAWNVAQADALWGEMHAAGGWRYQSLYRYANKVPHYLTGRELRAQWEAKNPGKAWPSYDPGGMVKNLFLKRPGWRAAEGHGQPALGYAQ